MAANTCQLITGIDNDNWRIQGIPGRSRRPAEESRKTFRRARHQHVRHLHAVSGRQRAGEGRALRVDGILRRHLLQLGARRAHQYRGQRIHRRRCRSTGRILIGAITFRKTAAAPTSSKSISRSTTSWTTACSATGWAKSCRKTSRSLTGKLRQPEPDQAQALRRGRGVVQAASRCIICPASTPEARDVEEAFGGRNDARKTFAMARPERKIAYEQPQLRGQTATSISSCSAARTYCHRAGLADRLACSTGKNQRQTPSCWVHTPRALREVADRNGYVKMITDAGGVVMSDTCPAISRYMPKGTKVIATGLRQAGALSAGHHSALPAWFGSVKQCVEAATDRTLERRSAMSEHAIAPTTRSCCTAARSSAAVAEGEALVTRTTRSPAGAASTSAKAP